MIDAPYWAPAQCEGFLLDWDGVIAETKLDFSGLREKYFGGRRAMLLEEGALLPPELRGQYMKELQEMIHLHENPNNRHFDAKRQL